MTTRLRAAGVLTGGALLLTACGSSWADTPAAAPATSSAASSTTAQPPMDAGDPTAGIPTVAPTTVPAAPREPADIASAAMGAYVVPVPTDPDTWFHRLEPYLTDDARRDYAYTDPANVPAHQLVGPPAVTRQTDYLAVVTQGTDIGVYTVSLARGDDGAWKVYRIDPPATAGS